MYMPSNPNPAGIKPPELEIVRTKEYDAQLKKMLPLKDHQDAFDQAVDSDLATDPDIGAVITGSGGFRKMRVARPDTPGGKSDGARVIYLHVPLARMAFLQTVYPKSQTDTVSAAGKQVLHSWAAEYKAYRTVRRRTGRKRSR
jgi:hypothetical protein